MRMTDIPFLTEVKEAYLSLRRSGMGRDEAEVELQKRYTAETGCGAEDDGTIFWIGLADGQWENREITSGTAKQALRALHTVEHIGWRIAPSDLSRRRGWYAHAPMPEKNMVTKRTKFRCEWKVGDTFAYELSGTAAQENNVSGQYILLRKVSDVEFGDGRLLPVVTLSLWGERPFPKNESAYSSVPPLKLDCGRFALPDHLYEYRAEIIVKNRKQLNTLPLIYVGNFPDVPSPDDEVVIQGAGYMTMLHPECFERDLNVRIKMSHLYENRLP